MSLFHRVFVRLESSVPAGRWPFPTLSLQSLQGCLDPYPAVFLLCTYPFLPEERRPHVRSEAFGTPNCLCNATSTEHAISGLQSFRYVQAPMFARPPGCNPPLKLKCLSAAGPFTPRNEHVVSKHELRHRYMSESGNRHGGTCTRWIAALQAAPQIPACGITAPVSSNLRTYTLTSVIQRVLAAYLDIFH